MAAFRPQEYKPGPEYRSEEDLQRAAAEIGTTIFHPAGTCRMGQGPQAVVDAQLRVHGIPGLRIADASIMPSLTSGNTCSPVLVIAEKAAQMILAERRREARRRSSKAPWLPAARRRWRPEDRYTPYRVAPGAAAVDAENGNGRQQ